LIDRRTVKLTGNDKADAQESAESIHLGLLCHRLAAAGRYTAAWFTSTLDFPEDKFLQEAVEVYLKQTQVPAGSYR
jgi:hypothetical protein